MQSIYMDHAATTPLATEVLEEMTVIWQGPGGNPSSVHAFGRNAKQQLGRARDRIATQLHCSPAELIFTSGGTESDNLGLAGAAWAQRKAGRDHIITTAIEHHAVLHAVDRLEEQGFRVTRLLPDASGAIVPAQVIEAMNEQTALVSVMLVNNETGTVQPIEQIGAAARERGILFHVDAIQALGRLPLRLREMPVDLASFSAHKINGPQGIGALYVAKGTRFEPQLLGGPQERNRRAGTENVAGACGFARALELAESRRESKRERMLQLRQRFLELLSDLIGRDAFILNGGSSEQVPDILNLSFPGVSAESLLMNLDIEGIAVSGGSACSSGALSRSHVLTAMGLSEQLAGSAVRFSFGLGNTMEEIEYSAQIVATLVLRIRTTA
ncbi:cysteine desulfurase family protein [Paenibacillus daejeonensis]|uniref:cysteine desulfurase family protein n=1 Tax=Paenibacillus daejeonensis TaxID=135193 RepID=UPI00039BA827|nr:cysteine desulfurase family protein [Paenibacillus daejeonensis]